MDKERDYLEYYPREWHSFDENIMRDHYEDMGPESDFKSEISHESFPYNPPKKLKDEHYLARLELFRENTKC